ncbi:MAG: hypothetical protein JWO62_2109 [Acidimicrobiaceae bacterium]|nr:hypothetical protein [Acidimicrobiaceae bacterium]
MTWAAWRVQRPQLLAALGVAIVAALWLVTTHAVMGKVARANVWLAVEAFTGLLGLSIGAPIVAGEVGPDTYRLAWSQSVSRLPPQEVLSCENRLAVHGAVTSENSERCALGAHVHDVVAYQPSSAYWPLQLGESAIFLAMAAAPLTVALVVVRRWRA